MIIARAPIRVCLGGGGTDVKEYYSEHGGFLLSAALNQYIYIVIHKHFEKNIRLCYSKKEIVLSSEEVKHPVVGAAMKYFDIQGGGIEIISFADIPSDTGLGTSSSFTVGLILVLAAYKGIQLTRYELAETAVKIEREILQEAGGKQDQYIAAFGGITRFIIAKDGRVHPTPLDISNQNVRRLEENTLIFYTGIRRNSPNVQNKLIEGICAKGDTLSSLHFIKELGLKTEQLLTGGDLDEYGGVLNEHWQAKKRLSDQISTGRVNQIYEKALELGATGGKLIGAGGGGYILFYCPTEVSRAGVRALMQKEEMPELYYRFEFEGAKILIDDTEDKKYEQEHLGPSPQGARPFKENMHEHNVQSR
ncbi:MAG: hypothetical protein HY586_05830 [Candidatus Omnitrophica bacterium]|nr:hypothetical protein [Candidatus Omnitrophota bacterium]